MVHIVTARRLKSDIHVYVMQCDLQYNISRVNTVYLRNHRLLSVAPEGPHRSNWTEVCHAACNAEVTFNAGLLSGNTTRSLTDRRSKQAEVCEDGAVKWKACYRVIQCFFLIIWYFSFILYIVGKLINKYIRIYTYSLFPFCYWYKIWIYSH
jgi:hypothetical protein